MEKREHHHGTLTLDYNNDYSSAYKQHSDHSYRILNPRLVNATAFGSETSKSGGSIQVKIVNSNKKEIQDQNDISPSRLRIASEKKQREDASKVEKSKSSVFEALGGSLYQVG